MEKGTYEVSGCLIACQSKVCLKVFSAEMKNPTKPTWKVTSEDIGPVHVAALFNCSVAAWALKPQTSVNAVVQVTQVHASARVPLSCCNHHHHHHHQHLGFTRCCQCRRLRVQRKTAVQLLVFIAVRVQAAAVRSQRDTRQTALLCWRDLLLLFWSSFVRSCDSHFKRECKPPLVARA